MGMGYSGIYADVISWDNLKEITPKASTAIDDTLKKNAITLDDFVQCLEWEDGDHLPEGVTADHISDLFNHLQKEFQAATSVGESVLELFPIYHDPDSGDRYDGISGGFFHVEGLYQLSPAGKKIASKVERSFFVRFG
jgi:hypothetical protein